MNESAERNNPQTPNDSNWKPPSIRRKPDFESAARTGMAEYRRTRAEDALEHIIFARFPITVDGVTIVASMRPSHPLPSADIAAAVTERADSDAHFYPIENIRLSGTSFPTVAKCGSNQQLVGNSSELEQFVEDMLRSRNCGRWLVSVFEQPRD